jgi:hypothetical protein
LPPKRTLIVLSAAVAIAYLVWILRSGIQVAVDTATYSRWADALIALGFDLPAYLRSQDFVAPPLFYLLWIVVVAALKTLLGASWMTGVVVLNWMALAAGVYLTIAAVRRVTRSTAAMLLAALLFVVAGDLLLFTPYVLSDLLFWGLSAAVLAGGIAVAALDDGRDRMLKRIAIGSGLLAVALLFRPVALPLTAFWVFAVLTWLAPEFVERFATKVIVAAAVLATLGIVVYAYLLNSPGAWMPQMLAMVAQEAREGVFVHNANPPMYVQPALTVAGLVRITLQKLLFFITPWLPHYSASHTLVNLLFFVPAYTLAAAAVANIRNLAPAQQRAVAALTIYALCLVVFHSMLLIDSDHRYRLPLAPALIMLAALGLEAVRRPQTLASTARTR